MQVLAFILGVSALAFFSVPVPTCQDGTFHFRDGGRGLAIGQSAPTGLPSFGIEAEIRTRGVMMKISALFFSEAAAFAGSPVPAG
jgi:hypothetical protein